MEYTVEVTGLTKKFGDFIAVDNVSFQIPKGEIFGLLGPNGAGKTTTIRMLCGVLIPTIGELKVAGFDVVKNPENVKKNIGYMSQKFSLYHDLSVNENLQFYAGLYGLDGNRKTKIKELIQSSGLSGLEKTLVGNLSGAWRQRLALACAIVHDPPVLFLDEPTAGVDPISRREFWEMIYSLAGKGVGILATTHYMVEAEFCNTIGLMHNAKLIANDTPGSLKSQIGGLMVEIECDQLKEAKSILVGIPGIEDIALHGILLHILIVNVKIKKIIDAELTKANFHFRSEIVQPTLEDVFLSKVRSEEKISIENSSQLSEERVEK
jgi:ABC-2 type transport system ATP-binding protein